MLENLADKNRSSQSPAPEEDRGALKTKIILNDTDFGKY
jgi:hypothetical protein